MSSSNQFFDIVQRHLGPPVSIEGIIRSLGIKLDKKAKLDDEIAGQLERLDDGTFHISANANDHYFRRRFTLAHELGHFMMHAHLIGDGVDDTKAYRSEPAGRFYNQKISPEHETEANKFASRLLMPKSLVTKLATPGESVAKLATDFQVSPQAMKIRLETLGIPHDGRHVGQRVGQQEQALGA